MTNKRREAPSEPLKRVLAPVFRAIAGHADYEVSFAAGRPEVVGKSVQLPEPPRAPSPQEVAIARGWADSVALGIGCHDAKVHRRVVPPPSKRGARAACPAWRRT
jgi:cobaltochelatase CobT